MTNYFNRWNEAYSFFQATFIGHRMCYEYSVNNSVKLVEISMSKRNFAHICGIHYAYGAQNFVRDLQGHHISEKNVLFAERKEIVEYKSQAMENLKLLISPGVRITDSGHFLNLCFDHALRSQKDLLALTLTNGNPGIYIPNSLINLHYSKSNSKSLKHSYEVHSVFSISNRTHSKYVYF